MMRATLLQLFPMLLVTLVLSVSGTYTVLAQCGSSGDPIVNITFGTVDDPDIGRGETTYDAVPPGQSPRGEGWYNLVSNINDGLSSWHNLRDHTGDAGGLMMIFNADDYPGEFYRIHVSDLCENTRFRFSAWIANANRAEECGGNPIPPNVRFVIEDMDGNRVNSTDDVTRDIVATPSPRWQEYGFEFDTGNQTEFYLVLINDNPGGCGNDLAIDDIQFTPCGPPISLAMDETLKQADTLFFCDGDTEPIALSGSITADDSYAAEPAFQWQSRAGEEVDWIDMSGERNEELTVMPTHNQWYRLTAAASEDNLGKPLCRISSEPIRIARLVPQPNTTDVVVKAPICVDGSVLLDPPPYVGTGVGSLTYQWQLRTETGLTEIPGATSVTYEFEASGPGVFYICRQAINGCGEAFITHVFQMEVPETIRTSLTLPQPEVCADNGPLLLSGGEISNGNAGMAGVYHGKGVVDGTFYPAVAGIGSHTITFSPPPDVLCQQSSQAIITVHDTVYIEPMMDVIMLAGQTATLRPQTNATQFHWSNEPGLDNYNTQYPVASPVETTTYTLTARNVFGCEKMESVTITVLDDLIVPNSFTPNDDGFNDAWEIKGLANYPNAYLQVFNRWGTLVFSSRGYAMPWKGQHNGTPLPTGTYYYTLSSDILIQPLSGSVAILR
ncbi:gliding motility-associated C-terminal domain-containing protein [Parapedobacter sp. 10938]|uniref:gliding motility-associated C-terminal domain-containing protein n=1 Tax=Parapedobacter flavus TaxID=3110225 RepID=UPI002DB64D6B|nr:gliding motility-associated C-terminal domain-containing protein [Parapedobacter sp. 10938]MEC3880580.1 gliding motility-associated C-terminal domain-containing protein [Parapedobacter sp. 10938]